MVTVYSGRFGDPLGDDSGDEESAYDLTGEQSCLFCHSSDGRWLRRLGPTPDGASVTLPHFVVTCEECERLLDVGDRRAVVARVEALSPGEGAELMELLETHLASPRRRRSS